MSWLSPSDTESELTVSAWTSGFLSVSSHNNRLFHSEEEAEPCTPACFRRKLPFSLNDEKAPPPRLQKEPPHRLPMKTPPRNTAALFSPEKGLPSSLLYPPEGTLTPKAWHSTLLRLCNFFQISDYLHIYPEITCEWDLSLNRKFIMIYIPHLHDLHEILYSIF